MSQVRTTFTSDDKDVQKALERMRHEMLKLQEQYAKVTAQSRQSGQEEKSKLNASIGLVTKLAGSYLSMHTILQAITSELERHRQLNQDAADVAETEAMAERNMIRQLATSDPVVIAQATEAAKSIAAQTGLALKDSFNALGDALSARGAGSVEDAINATLAAAKIAPEEPESVRLLAAGALDLGKVTGSGDAEANLGMALSVQGTSRVTSLEALGQNVIPGILGLSSFGGKTEENAAIVSALTSGVGKKSGAEASTGSIQLGRQLEAFFLAQEKKGGPATTGPLERIRILQNDKALRDDFMSDATFESNVMPKVRDLLNGVGDTSAALERNLKEIGGVETGGAIFRERLDALNRSGDQPFLIQSLRSKVVEESGDRLAGNEFRALEQRTLDAALKQTRDPTDALMGFSEQVFEWSWTQAIRENGWEQLDPQGQLVLRQTQREGRLSEFRQNAPDDPMVKLLENQVEILNRSVNIMSDIKRAQQTNLNAQTHRE